MNDDKYDLLVKRIEQLEKELAKEKHISDHLAACIDENRNSIKRLRMNSGIIL